jgi:hypothetical protein
VKRTTWPPPLVELFLLPIPKRCKCGLESIWGTKRGRALHPMCEHHERPATAQQLRQAIALVHSILPIADVGTEGVGAFAYPPTDHYRTDRPFVPPPAPFPCAACGTSDYVMRWLPADVWRCPEHTPMSFPVQSWEMRGGDSLPAPRPAPPIKEIAMQTTYTGVLWTCDACGREHTSQDGKPPLGYSGNVMHTTTLQQESAVWEWYACGDRCAGKAVRGAKARRDLEASDDVVQPAEQLPPLEPEQPAAVASHPLQVPQSGPA